MYLHIGNDIILKDENILFILDYEKLQQKNNFKNFLEKIDKQDIKDVSGNKFKSIIVTKEKNKIKAYISNISSTTLGKRKLI